MRNLEVDWQQVPLSLWIFEGILVVGVFLVYARASVPVRPIVFGVFFVLVWSYLLLRGNRWIWFATLGIYLLNIPWIVLGSVRWESIVSTILGLVFLLLPSTREYFERPSQKRPS